MKSNAKSYERSGDPLSSFLGWFSLALGAAELLSPRVVAKGSGVMSSPATLRLFGLREIASGLGILSRRSSPVPAWSRVIGDILDLSVLGKSFVEGKNNKLRVSTATAAVLGITALDLYSSVNKSQQGSIEKPVTIKEMLAINKTPDVLYTYWRDFNNLPKVMSFIETVEILSPARSRWTTKPIAGKRWHWESELVTEKEAQLIKWETVPGSEINHRGSVQFERLSGVRGTSVIVNIEFYASPGTFGLGLASKFLNFIGEHKLKHDLRRLKQLMETGVIATTEGQPAGRRSGSSLLDSVASA